MRLERVEGATMEKGVREESNKRDRKSACLTTRRLAIYPRSSLPTMVNNPGVDVPGDEATPGRPLDRPLAPGRKFPSCRSVLGETLVKLEPNL